MALHGLVYVSQVRPGLTVPEIDALVEDASKHNHIAGITGVLFTDGLQFLQYIEGPHDGLSLAYSRILNSTSHKEIVELGRSHGGSRRFPYWSMHWIPVEHDEFKLARASDWRGLAARRGKSTLQVPTGVDRIGTLVQPHLQGSAVVPSSSHFLNL